jgi:hypothetical protein
MNPRVVILNDLENCYELIKDRVKVEDWLEFSKSLPETFHQIPETWPLNDALRHRLLFQIQWEVFNPDPLSEPCEKEKITELFIKNFLGARFFLRWKGLLERVEGESREKWLHNFCRMDTLLDACKSEPGQRINWLMHFDSEQRFGKSQRVRIIKTRSEGLVSELLGVDKTMDWETIRSRYRQALKTHHPDLRVETGASASVDDIVTEYQRLKMERTAGKNFF